MDNFDFSKVVYRYRPIRKPQRDVDIEAIGFDSEADRDGNPFMYCLSDGSVYTPETLLKGLFTREHRDRHYVVYNLKYEQGAILKIFPAEVLEVLRKEGKAEYDGYRIKVVGYKKLVIGRGKHSVTFWDMYSFFNMSLATAARQFTNLTKFDVDTTKFTPDYIREHWDMIARYCRRDAEITAELFKVVKGMCRRLGINPTTFYSIASISYKYARENTDYVTVKHLWDKHRDVLEAACNAYNGGKFEVVVRGKGYFYEYDINSAYPYEIANLVDISQVKIKRTTKYQKSATYGFLYVDIDIADYIHHPVACKRKTVNIYPVGHIRKWITKQEYDYLAKCEGVTLKILRGIWLFPRYKRRPYLKLINNLYKVKNEAKQKGDKELYHFTKILLNSLYGKFVQLIPHGDEIEATTCWNPVYGAIITANVRIRITEVQQKYPSVVAVHTDSVISKEPLPLPCSDKLGDWTLSVHGLGLIIGCGVYQIDTKVRFRGFPVRCNLFELLNKSPPIITIPDARALTWREVIENHWDKNLINHFTELAKELDINFDRKRVWLGEWQTGKEALEKELVSLPLVVF